MQEKLFLKQEPEGKAREKKVKCKDNSNSEVGKAGLCGGSGCEIKPTDLSWKQTQ